MLLADPATEPLATVAATCAQSLRQRSQDASYRYLPDSVKQAWDVVRSRYDPELQAKFWQLVVLWLIRNFDPSKHHHTLPDTLVSQYRKSFSRLVLNVESTGFDWFDVGKDLALKELGVCSGLLIPAGARVLELQSGWSRRILLSNGWGGALRVLAFLLQGGRKNFPVVRDARSFGDSLTSSIPRAGGCATLQRVARLLALNVKMQGVFVGGWLYDPQLVRVTPHLAFFREIGLQSGARLFRVGVDSSGDAFAKSKHRARLHHYKALDFLNFSHPAANKINTR